MISKEQIIHQEKTWLGVISHFIVVEGVKYRFVNGYKRRVEFAKWDNSSVRIRGLVYPSYGDMKEGAILHQARRVK
jgi:hypothetical protein